MLPSSCKRIFISAGEKSGDLHAGALVRELRDLTIGESLRITGLGGDSLKSEGVDILYHVDHLSSSGLTDVARKYVFFRRVLRDSVRHIQENRPEAVVLVDFPGFNLKLAETIREFYRGKVIYYISPQVWAWHSSRVRKIKQCIDQMLVVFPFEVEFYRKFGVKADYVGHPLVRRIQDFLAGRGNETPYFVRSQISDARGGSVKITILPGTRKQEVDNHLPVLIETARKLKWEFNAEIFFHSPAVIQEAIYEFRVSRADTYELILNSDMVITKAGTATVECALLGTPMIIFYRTTRLNYHLIKPLVKIKNMGMVNILLGKNVVREFIQKEFVPENLLIESRRILKDPQYRKEMKENLREVWKVLGDKNASANAARIIVDCI